MEAKANTATDALTHDSQTILEPGGIAATYLPRYRIAGAGADNAEGLTFYEALKALKASTQRNDVSAHIKREGRCVAFFSSWHKAFRPMPGAACDERTGIEEFPR